MRRSRSRATGLLLCSHPGCCIKTVSQPTGRAGQAPADDDRHAPIALVVDVQIKVTLGTSVQNCLETHGRCFINRARLLPGNAPFLASTSRNSRSLQDEWPSFDRAAVRLNSYATLPVIEHLIPQAVPP